MTAIVIRLLDPRGLYYPRAYCLGAVEIRNAKADTISERDALAESCRIHNEELSERTMRIVTVVSDASGEFDADAVAEERFEEALDVLASEVAGISSPSLLQAGAIISPIRGIASPRLSPQQRRPMGFAARFVREQFPRCDWPQFLLTNQASELGQRMVRSYHWSRKAHLEANRQLRVLFRWFAMEAVWMLRKDDDIVPRLQWALGFPNGPGAALLSARFVAALGAHPTIGAWKNQIHDRLMRVKTLRNDSVHSGFRRQDLAADALRDFDEITTIACARVQACARAGILAKISTAVELFEYLPLLVEADANYINDVHGNIIFGLENPMPRRWSE